VVALLVSGFAEHYPAAWPDEESTLNEVHESNRWASAV
jgi:hypothetical protein